MSSYAENFSISESDLSWTLITLIELIWDFDLFHRL
jgi:hypothetical protein